MNDIEIKYSFGSMFLRTKSPFSFEIDPAIKFESRIDFSSIWTNGSGSEVILSLIDPVTVTALNWPKQKLKLKITNEKDKIFLSIIFFI